MASLLAVVAARGQEVVEVRGQVTSAPTGLPIEGARVTLDREPADGVAEFWAESSPFGFYRLAAATGGSYRFRVVHGGFGPHEAAVGVAGGAREVRNAALAPLAGARFDVFARVSDVVTGLALRGAPVKLERFAAADDAVAAEFWTLPTDDNGHAAFRGMANGFYRFMANEGGALPKWEFYTTEGKPGDKRFLNRAHAANMLLKPIYQDLFIRLTGTHPAFGANKLKGIYVELTGVDPGDPSAVVIPSRTGVTDENGRVEFRRLPATAYVIRTRKLGFTAVQQMVQPNAAGDFNPGNTAGNPVSVAVAAQPTHLYVNTQHPYAVTRVFDFLAMDIEGLAGSNAEGMVRRQTFYNVPNLLDDRAFFNLLPGRYRVRVNGQPQFGLHGVRPHFKAEETVDLPPGDPAHGNFTDMDLALQVVPATVRGRLMAAEEMGSAAPFGPENGEAHARTLPKAGVPIEIVEYEDDKLLKPAFRTNVVVTDANGEFVLPLPPARYGLRIASLTDYYGREVRVRDLSAPVGAQNPRTVGWPHFQRWPHSFPVEPLLFESGHEYRLDIQVQKQIYAVEGFVETGGGIPELMVSGPNPAVVALKRVSDGSVLQSMTLTQVHNVNYAFRFQNLPPGSYTYSISHPHNTFTHGGEQGPAAEEFTFGSHAAPGEVPASDPFLAAEPRPFSKGSARAQATAKVGTATIAYRFHNYLGGGVYEPTALHTSGGFVMQPDYAGGKIRTGQTIPPTGGFTFWRGLFLYNVWFEGRVEGNSGDHVFDIYFGRNGDHGPLGNVISRVPPLPVQWRILAVNAMNPAELVAGVTRVELGGGGAPQDIQGELQVEWEGTPYVSSAANDNWIYEGQQTKLVDATIPSYETRLLMSRGVKIQGTVTNRFAGAPLGGARVQFLNRFGGRESEAVTDGQGNFVFAGSFTGAEPKFLRVVGAGFKPWQSRHTASDAVPDGPTSKDSTVTVRVELDPIAPAPEVDGVALDRRGLFLPGAKLAGSSDGGLSLASGALTLSWRARARSTAISAELTAVDRGDGTSAGPQAVTLEDPVAEVWLVDPRGYTNDPSSGRPIPMGVPTAGGNAALLAWLQNIATNTVTNVFHQRVTNLVATANPGEVATTNEVRIWRLPPGEFRPVFAAVTRGGAVGVAEPFADPGTAAPLKGLPSPAWFGFASDLLAATGALAPSAETVSNWVPEGRFVPLPIFSVGISADAEGFLKYEHACEVNWTHGFDTPASEWLHLAPGTIGLDFTGLLEFGLSGADTNIYFRTSADLDLTDIPLPKLRKMAPKGFPLDVKPEYSALNVEASTTKRRSFDVNQPHEFEVEDTIEGSYAAGFKANLKPLTSKLPYLGPALLALDESGQLVISGVVDGAIGLKSTNIWRTPFPASREGGSTTDPDPHVLRRHFLGGEEKQFDLLLCFRFGAGLDVEAFSGRGKARGKLNLAGNQCTLSGGDTPLPSVALEINPNGDWPIFRRISGNITATLEASLDLWVTSIEKDWEWELWSFDHSFGTEPLFEWAPMNLGVTVRSPTTALAATFNPGATNLIDNLFSRGAASATADGKGMLFTDVNPATGEMALKFAGRGVGGVFGAPVTLAHAGGIVAVEVAERPDGGWMAVWTELDGTETANPFPPSRLMFSRSVDGATWTGPELVAGLSDVATELRLLAAPGKLGLAFLHTGDGPEAGTASLGVSGWSGSAWSTPVDVVGGARIIGFDGAGSGVGVPASALFGVTLADGELQAWSWDFTGPPEMSSVAADAGGDLAIAAGGSFFLAFERKSGGIGLSYFDGGQWSSLGTPVGGAPTLSLDVAVIAEAPGRVVLAWIEGGNEPSVRSATTDFGGILQAGPLNALTTRDELDRVQLMVEGGAARAQVRRKGEVVTLLDMPIPLAASPARLSSPLLLADAFEFTISGNTAAAFRVQVSTDLQAWSEAVTISNPAATQTVRIPFSSSSVTRFYRTVAP